MTKHHKKNNVKSKDWDCEECLRYPKSTICKGCGKRLCDRCDMSGMCKDCAIMSDIIKESHTDDTSDMPIISTI